MKRIKADANETRLERRVRCWLNSRAADYSESGVEGVLKDLIYGGCQSGMVGELIYYKDVLPFFKRYRKEISALLQAAIDNMGDGPEAVFGDKWDKEDPLVMNTQNQNLLAWFGFEEAARIVAGRAEIEV